MAVCRQSLLPVTALEFCSIAGTGFLLAGEGPTLKVFSKSGELLLHSKLLPFRRIHGLRVAPQGLCSDGCSAPILVFGQKAFCLIQLCSDSSEVRISSRSKVTELLDWVLDMHWFAYRDVGCFELAIVTAHNAVIIYKNTGSTEISQTVYHSEVNCILYSARLTGSCASRLSVASGTVFNQILLWHLTGGEVPKTRVQVRLALCGHEGVIFSVRFSEDQKRLVSVSDDRTVRVWDIPPNWRSMNRVEQNCCSLVLYGHTARVWDARLLPSCVVSVGEDALCRVWDYGGRCVAVMEGHRGKSIWSMAVDSGCSVVATGGGDCSIRLFSLVTAPIMRSVDTKTPEPSRPVVSSDMAGSGARASDTPRLLSLRGETALCLTSEGYVYALAVDSVKESEKVPTVAGEWCEVLCDPEFSGYSVMALSPCQQFLAVGSLRGWIKILRLCGKGVRCVGEVAWRAYEGKVFSLLWSVAVSRGLDKTDETSFDALLVSCGPEGQTICWSVQDGPSSSPAVSAVALLSLPPSRHRWPSAAIALERKERDDLAPDGSSQPGSPGSWSFVLGDRKGSLHSYHGSDQSATPAAEQGQEVYLAPVHSLFAIHGPNGVTCAVFHNGCVFTAGRDGYCRQLSLSGSGHLTELSKFRPVKGMDWIERLMFTAEDLLVLGFHTTDMVLYSRNHNKHIARFDCGGGHRSYGFSSQTELLTKREATAVYIKQSVIYYKTLSLQHYFTRPLIQEAFTGREAVSMCVLHSNPGSGAGVIAVGSEDCSICLLTVDGLLGSSPTPDIMAVLQCHNSSVRALSNSNSGRRDRHNLLFSGGGRASMKVWLVPDVTDDRGKLEVCLESEFCLFGGKKKRSKSKKLPSAGADNPPSECRIMALVSFPFSEVEYCDPDSVATSAQHYVAAGCSDGIVRQFVYDERNRIFSVLPNLSFHERCLLSLEHVIHKHRGTGDGVPTQLLKASVWLLSAGTDGTIAVWSLDSMLSSWLLSQGAEVTSHDILVTRSGDKGLLLTDPEGLNPDEVGGSRPHPVAFLRLHQSGVNDIAVTAHGDGCYLVATVGDDNALVMSEVNVSLSPSLSPLELSPKVSIEKCCAELSAHTSSITGVSFIGRGCLVTTSIDQRVRVWRVRQTGAGYSLELASAFTHDVADASSLRTYHTSEGGVVLVVCGVGLQCYCLHMQ